jgi:hypothetical protein
MSWAGALLLLLGLLGFAALIFLALLYVFSHLTGWRALARAYPMRARFRGPQYRTGGVLVGNWGWAAPPLRVGLDDWGIVLHPVQPFRLAFAGVHLPWQAIAAVEFRAYMFFEALEVQYDGVERALIGFLPSAAATAIAARVERERWTGNDPAPERGTGDAPAP